ncbi:MAG: secretin N-terminal domain-containing protein [Gammaproteobacteria bacterium]|nr:general secretion pathway protein GspD [Rhodocyclaceae bacterium]MBU3910069.1 secretin N-terminal domain-containing protein [Gammaproteobacteria bacterium]MBU3988986.1 secretin N-terminal domain-containing protein [Gammaproteobacteria bacterium]MBU4003896.1 secretin N-terminal domain-containing protein [Gammaproteobacteria bacterium]MBU4022531.1 secretin N-terminal domain-containing protein [Gammaproteobacteria bacterium]
MKILILLPLLGFLAACTAPQQRPDVVRERIGEELAQAASGRKAAEGAERALLMPLMVEMPKQENHEPRFDLSVVGAPATQVFMAIVTGTRYNMLVGPEVTGSITVSLKDVTVKEALESIRELYGYEFNIRGNRISIQPNTLQTRLFQVNYLASRRQGAAELRVTSSSIASSGAAAGSTSTPSTGTTPVPAGAGSGATTGSNITSRVTTDSNTNFWKDLDDALRTIVSGEGRNVVVNSISGVVVIRALPGELRSVEQYLKATQIMVERQVMLEAKILEVRLFEQYQAGVNWSTFNGQNNRLSIGVVPPGSTMQPSGALTTSNVSALPGLGGAVAATALGGGFVGLAFQTANFAALLNFLETQGSVSVLSSPRIASINNQKAVLKVGTDELFVTNVTTTTTSTAAGTTATPSLTLQPYFSGISLDVTPQIDSDGNIILHVHPAVSTVTEKDKIIDLGSLGQFKLPLASSSVNETDSIVRVQDGNIVAIGGLMTQEQTNNRSGLPGTVNSVAGTLFGQRGNSLSKRELVILLKPTIIHDDRAWMKDIEQSGERVRNLALPPLSVPLN